MNSFKLTIEAKENSTLALAPTALTNRAPIAEDNSVTVPKGTAVSGNVLTDASPTGKFDSDPDGDPITLTGFVVGAYMNGVHTYEIDKANSYDAGVPATITGFGTITFDASGNYTFTPAHDYLFEGAPTITYTIKDSAGNLSSATLDIKFELDNTVIEPKSSSTQIYGTDGDDIIRGHDADPVNLKQTVDSLRGLAGDDVFIPRFNSNGGQQSLEDYIFGGDGYDTVHMLPYYAGVARDANTANAFYDFNSTNFTNNKRVTGIEELNFVNGVKDKFTIESEDHVGIMSGSANNDTLFIKGDADDTVELSWAGFTQAASDVSGYNLYESASGYKLYIDVNIGNVW